MTPSRLRSRWMYAQSGRARLLTGAAGRTAGPSRAASSSSAGKRPAHPLPGHPLQVQRDRTDADRARLGYRPVRQPLLVLEPQDLTNLPHQ